MRRSFLLLTTMTLGMALGGCTSTGSAAAGQNDPFEQTNRAIFKVNIALDKAVMRPVAKFYVSATPGFIRTGIHNVLDNLGKPVTFGNDLLQGEGLRAGQTVARMFVNTTLGIGGLIDVASMTGLPDHDEDFGQTLAVWGFGDGAYLMLPLMGPSNPRDLVGKGADYFIDPFTYAHFDYENLASDLRIGFSLLDTRSRALDELDSIERSSIDFYATTRSLYRQLRKSQISNGAGGDDLSDDIPDVPADDPAPTKE